MKLKFYEVEKEYLKYLIENDIIYIIIAIIIESIPKNKTTLDLALKREFQYWKKFKGFIEKLLNYKYFCSSSLSFSLKKSIILNFMVNLAGFLKSPSNL